MANQTWEILANAPSYSSENTGTVYKESTTLTDVSPGGNTLGQAFTIGRDCPPLEAGTILRYTARGTYSNTGTPTIILGLYYGGVAGVALAETIAIKTSSGVSNQSWALEATSRVISVGPTGKIITQGVVDGFEAVSAETTSVGSTMMPETTSTGGEATINTDESKILTIGAKWGASSASNLLTVYQWYVEILN
jgi:hypothetical protein